MGGREREGRGGRQGRLLKDLGESAQSVIVIRSDSAWMQWGIGRFILWTVTKENRYEARWFKQPQGCQEKPFTDARPKVVFDFSAHTATLGVCEARQIPNSEDLGRSHSPCLQ